jgi:hypothetical protein
MTVRSATLLYPAYSAVHLAHLQDFREWVTRPYRSQAALHRFVQRRASPACSMDTASQGQASPRDFNGRESIQMGTPVWWMLGFMRAICAHTEAVEARTGNWILTPVRDVVEDKLTV